VVPAAIDPEVGEELVIFIREEAAAIKQLSRLKPFHLMMRAGVELIPFGPVGYLLFWIPQPSDLGDPVFSSRIAFDPTCARTMAVCRRLAAQGHYHLFLMVGNEMRRCYRFENTYTLDQDLDAIIEKRGRFPMLDLASAVRLFREEHSVQELIDQPEGGQGRTLVFTTSPDTDIDRDWLPD
jgi:hypothetical protein